MGLFSNTETLTYFLKSKPLTYNHGKFVNTNE